MSDVGGNGEDVLSDPQRDVPVANITLTLDDAAPNPLPADSALSPGTFRPLDDDTGEVQLNDEPDSDLFLPPAPSTSDNVALSTFNGVDPNGTWNLYVMDDYPAEPSDGEVQRPEFFCGWSIEITTTGGEPVTGPVPPADFDGDGDTDVSVFRPASGYWFVNGGATVAFGTAGDIPVPADYDGNGTTDIAVYRPTSGYWFVNGGPTVAWGTAERHPGSRRLRRRRRHRHRRLPALVGLLVRQRRAHGRHGARRRHPRARRLRRRRRHRHRRLPALDRATGSSTAGPRWHGARGRHPRARRLRRRRRHRHRRLPALDGLLVRQRRRRPSPGAPPATSPSPATTTATATPTSPSTGPRRATGSSTAAPLPPSAQRTTFRCPCPTRPGDSSSHHYDPRHDGDET